MRVRCPHCHHPIEIVEEAELWDIHCDSCDSNFNLVAAETESLNAQSQDQVLGRFKLQQKLGVGAFGAVWKAHDTELDRTVAIKIPRKGQLDAVESEQFLREARAAARLKHPAIVSVHEFGRFEETFFIVSDYIDGLTLADRLTGSRMNPREAARLVEKVASAVDHAHQQGVIHRDLKPSNIILDHNNEPHVMDFGLAKREAAEVTMTADGAILGTPAYMSPEQARGDGHNADRRSDVYSLGVVLFELLTGERPFRGNTRMLIHQVLNDDAPSPRKLNATISEDLETICLKCLEKSAGKRYATASELQSDLARFLRGEPIVARPVGRWERGCKFARRHPALTASTLAAIGFLMLGLAGTGAGLYVARSEARNARQQATSAELARSKAEKLSSELAATQDRQRESAVKALINAGDFAYQRGKWRAALESYDQALGEDPSDPTTIRLRRIRPLLELYKLTEARDEISILIENESPADQRAEIMMLAGLVQAQIGNTEKGLEYFRKALEFGGLREADEYFAKAMLAEDVKLAVGHAEAALVHEPFRTDAHHYLILLDAFNGRPDKAEKRIEALEKIFPEDRNYVFMNAILLAVNNRQEEADEKILSARGLFSEKQLEASRREVKAVGQMLDALSDSIDGSSNPLGLINLMGRIIKSKASLTKEAQQADHWAALRFISTLPATAPLTKILPGIVGKMATGQYNAARHELDSVIGRYQIHELYLLHGKLSFRIANAGDTKEKLKELLVAEQSLQKALDTPKLLKETPPFAELDALAVQTELIYWHKEQLDEKELGPIKDRARRNVQTLIAVAKNPNNRWHEWTRGKAYMFVVGAAATEQLDQAREMAVFWTSAEPGNANAHGWLARIEQMQGNLAHAIRAADKAIELDGSLSRAKATRQKVMEEFEKAIVEFRKQGEPDGKAAAPGTPTRRSDDP